MVNHAVNSAELVCSSGLRWTSSDQFLPVLFAFGGVLVLSALFSCSLK